MMKGPSQHEETLRLHLANERTMLAWVRTGIALMAFGFAIARFGIFLRQVVRAGAMAEGGARTVGSAWVGALLVALGMIANLMATYRYARIRNAIERGEIGGPTPGLVYVLGITATLIGLMMTVLLFRTLAD
jgi:putative membrane protein